VAGGAAVQEPATRSFTVLETSTSLAPASPATRAPMCTARPRMVSPATSTSPVCTPARISRPSSPTAPMEAAAQRTARAGPVEARQKAVARRVDLAASEVRQLGADCGVVPFDELAPRAITELRRPFGRSHDVGEQDG
jgi:hypothetical protein